MIGPPKYAVIGFRAGAVLVLLTAGCGDKHGLSDKDFVNVSTEPPPWDTGTGNGEAETTGTGSGGGDDTDSQSSTFVRPPDAGGTGASSDSGSGTDTTAAADTLSSSDDTDNATETDAEKGTDSSTDTDALIAQTCREHTHDVNECVDCCDCQVEHCDNTYACREGCRQHEFSFNEDFIEVVVERDEDRVFDHTPCIIQGEERACKDCCDCSEVYLCGNRKDCRLACEEELY